MKLHVGLGVMMEQLYLQVSSLGRLVLQDFTAGGPWDLSSVKEKMSLTGPF